MEDPIEEEEEMRIMGTKKDDDHLSLNWTELSQIYFYVFVTKLLFYMWLFFLYQNISIALLYFSEMAFFWVENFNKSIH
jgi:hypothetical protein